MYKAIGLLGLGSRVIIPLFRSWVLDQSRLEAILQRILLEERHDSTGQESGRSAIAFGTGGAGVDFVDTRLVVAPAAPLGAAVRIFFMSGLLIGVLG